MNTISKIYDALENFDMKFALGFAEHGNPTVGLRSVDNIIIDDISLVIAGDAYDTSSNTKLLTVGDIMNADEDNIIVHVRATAYLRDIFTINLGRWKVIKREVDSERLSGVLKLQKL